MAESLFRHCSKKKCFDHQKDFSRGSGRRSKPATRRAGCTPMRRKSAITAATSARRDYVKLPPARGLRLPGPGTSAQRLARGPPIIIRVARFWNSHAARGLVSKWLPRATCACVSRAGLCDEVRVRDLRCVTRTFKFKLASESCPACNGM